jgi:hypothetical protein
VGGFVGGFGWGLFVGWVGSCLFGHLNYLIVFCLISLNYFFDIAYFVPINEPTQEANAILDHL